MRRVDIDVCEIRWQHDSVTRELDMYIQDIFPILEKSRLCAEDDPLAESMLQWTGILD